MLAGVERKMLGPDDIKRQFEEMKTKIASTRVQVHRRLSAVAAQMGGDAKLEEPEVCIAVAVWLCGCVAVWLCGLSAFS